VRIIKITFWAASEEEESADELLYISAITIISILVVLGFELRASCLLGRCSLYQPFFVLGSFDIGSYELFA
jgi:hypothetical protein